MTEQRWSEGVDKWSAEWEHWPITPDVSEALLAHPVVRAVYHAMGWVATQEEGFASIAHGICTALGNQPKHWELPGHRYDEGGEWMQQTAEQLNVGYHLGRQILSAYFRFPPEGPTPDGPDMDEWSYEQSPEQHIELWRAALAEKDGR